MTTKAAKPLTVCSWPRVRIPDACRGKEIVIGIDEAGRGPVLGSLIYCAAFWPADQNEEICKLGFDDSKKVAEGERDRLFEGIKKHPSIGWVIEELTAEEISEDMLRVEPVSLNAISYNAVIRALEIIRDGGRGHIAPTSSSSGSINNTNPTDSEQDPPIVGDIFIDTVGDPEYYKSRLTNALGTDFANFTIEKKADATYKVVSAASIIAKVTRDTLLAQWQWSESTVTLDKSFGSGYPGDERCVTWLANAQNTVFGFPNLIRFSWSTSREALKVSEALCYYAC
jgi:ribonuclease H2 subunit A